MIKRSLFCIMLFGILILTVIPGICKPVILVKSGKSVCTIVIPPDAQKTVKKAADDLVYHLNTMSGAKVQIVTSENNIKGNGIWLGVLPKNMKQPFELLTPKLFWPDGYMLISTTRGLIILSPRPDGISNGVYGVLEDYLGCHWFTPGQVGEYIPKHKNISLNIPGGKSICKPSYELRSPWYNGNALPRTYLNQIADIAVWKTRNRGGGVIGYGGQEWSATYPKDLQEKEPGLQAMVNGKREPRGPEGQICMTYPRAVEIAAERFRWVFKNYPEYDYYTFSPNDNDNWCQCDACMATGANPAERVLAFSNKVAEAVNRDNPGKGITILPYSSTIEPPTKPIKGAENLYPIICSYAMEQVKPKTDNNAWCNAYRSRIERWMKLLPRAWSYDYIGWYPGPWTLFRKLETEQNYYRKIGFSGIMPEYIDRNLGTDIHMWLSYRISWDSSLKVKNLLDLFYPQYYGPAAKSIRSFHTKVEEHMLATGGTGELMEVARMYPEKLTDEGIAVYESAARQVSSGPVQLQRVNNDLACLKMLKAFNTFYAANLAVTRDGQMDKRQQALDAARIYLDGLNRLADTPTIGGTAGLFVKSCMDNLNDPGTVFSKPGDFLYQDGLDNGGKSFQAKSRKGFRPDIYGMGLPPGATGELIYDMRATDGLKFTSAKLTNMYFYLPEGGTNSVDVSLDGGTTWKTAFKNQPLSKPYAEYDLTEHISGTKQFLLRFTAFNPGSAEILDMDGWAIAGKVE